MALQEVTILDTRLTPVQLNYLFLKISLNQEVRLRVLYLGGQNLSSVSVEVLLSGFRSLKKLKMINCILRAKQLTQLFDNATNNTNLFLRESFVL